MPEDYVWIVTDATLPQLPKEREMAAFSKADFKELRREISIGLEASERSEVIDAEVVFQNLQAKLKQ